MLTCDPMLCKFSSIASKNQLISTKKILNFYNNIPLRATAMIPFTVTFIFPYIFTGQIGVKWVLCHAKWLKLTLVTIRERTGISVFWFSSNTRYGVWMLLMRDKTFRAVLVGTQILPIDFSFNPTCFQIQAPKPRPARTQSKGAQTQLVQPQPLACLSICNDQ